MPKIFRFAQKKGWGVFNISQNLWKKGWGVFNKGGGFNMNAPVWQILSRNHNNVLLVFCRSKIMSFVLKNDRFYFMAVNSITVFRDGKFLAKSPARKPNQSDANPQ